MTDEERDRLRDNLQAAQTAVFQGMRLDQERIAELESKLAQDALERDEYVRMTEARFARALALVEAYRDLHAQACDDSWADDECACGGLQLLAEWDRT